MELFGDYTVDARSNCYKFVVKRVVIWKSYEGALRVLGDHIEGKSGKDVEAITFSNFALGRFPRLLGCFFPNLKVVTVNSCGVQSITKEDLKGLTNLSQLSLNGNHLTSLPEDLFDPTPNLEIVSFYGNKIRFIGESIFDELKNLKYANFKMNLTIDVCFKEGSNAITLHELKKIISSNCQEHDMVEVYFEKLKMFERFMSEMTP